jgi:hypothetical protein
MGSRPLELKLNPALEELRIAFEIESIEAAISRAHFQAHIV